jgi:hypothetical protein
MFIFTTNLDLWACELMSHIMSCDCNTPCYVNTNQVTPCYVNTNQVVQNFSYLLPAQNNS